MLQENEIIMLLLGIGVLIFVILNRKQVSRLPESRIIIAAYVVLVLGWIVTNLESYWLPDLFNALEHLCYAISTMLLAMWCFKIFRNHESL